MKLMGNANVLSPTNDSLDHQISGRNLDAIFRDGKLKKVDVKGNGMVVYYSVDDENNVSVNRATCAHISLVFTDGLVKRITLLNKPEGRFENMNDKLEEDVSVKARIAKPEI
jgi:hypothetical protein